MRPIMLSTQMSEFAAGDRFISRVWSACAEE